MIVSRAEKLCRPISNSPSPPISVKIFPELRIHFPTFALYSSYLAPSSRCSILLDTPFSVWEYIRVTWPYPEKGFEIFTFRPTVPFALVSTGKCVNRCAACLRVSVERVPTHRSLFVVLSSSQDMASCFLSGPAESKWPPVLMTSRFRVPHTQ